MNALLAVWFALISADRIDLAGGKAPFVLTPFLALTPFVLLSEGIRRWRDERPVEISAQTLWYVGLCGALLCFVLPSVLIAPDATASASRALLLVAHIGATVVVEAVSTFTFSTTDFLKPFNSTVSL